MRIVVTGGSGFIGTDLVARLSEAEHEVVILDRIQSRRFPRLTRMGDIRRLDDVLNTFEGAHVVYHLAAEHRDDVTPPSLYDDVNVEGTRNIVRAAEVHGIERLIFTSSSAVYGLPTVEVREDSPLTPVNRYGETKRIAEEIVNDWAERTGGSLLIVRPCAVFGPGSKGNVARLIEVIARKRFIMVGNGRNRKSLAYVGNLAVFLAAATNLELSHEIVNYADKPDLSMNELVQLLHETAGHNGDVPRVPYWLGILGAHAVDVLATVTRRSFSIGSQRLRRFCASTRMSTDRLQELQSLPQLSIEEALRQTVKEMTLVRSA